MTFADIAAGTTVFIDANTFIYAFSQHSALGPACRDLLDRVDQQDVNATSSSHVLSETAHRLMTLEACALFGWQYARVGRRLKRSPSQLQQLDSFRQSIDEIVDSEINVVDVTSDLVVNATEISQQHGLLSGDALIIAVMQYHGITQIASADADFDRVTGITRFAPA